MSNTPKTIENSSYILEKLLEYAYDGIVIIDKNGIITLISKAYADFLKISPSEAVGQHVTQVIENTRLHHLLKTGKIERERLQIINGNYMLASRYPLIKDGEIIGAMGKVIFRNINELNILQKRINVLKDQLKNVKSKLKTHSNAKYSFDHIIGQSDKILLAKTMAEKGALTNSNILLLGESGTGKELFAHAIHQGSSRSDKPFIKINCAAIPKELLESELFGYEPGAFTGALKNGKSGKFELANGGTLFLDEVGDMPTSMQVKLLRVLQEKEIEKIGGRYSIPVDVRIIAATNKSLENLVKEGTFREDLFYRLNVFSIKIPALRERPEDIDILAPYLLNKICNRLGKYVNHIAPNALQKLQKHSWGGNVRELENVLERAINLVDKGDIIQTEHLSREIIGEEFQENIIPLKEALEKSERDIISKALRQTNNNKAKAARLLNISRSKLYERMNRLGL